MHPAVSATILLIAVLAVAACTNVATNEPDADALFSSGTALLSQGSEADLRAAIDTLTQCTESVPDYAPCHAALARAYVSIGGNYNIMAPGEAWPPARRAAERAVELDGDLAIAHLALAEVLAGQDWDWEGAEREYMQALERAPDDAETLSAAPGFSTGPGARAKRPRPSTGYASYIPHTQPPIWSMASPAMPSGP